jgi:GTP-binding protein
LIDSRLEPQKIDLEFCCWMGEIQIPFVLAFTKADKQSTAKTNQNVAAFKKALGGWFEEIPPCFVTSSEKSVGREEILKFVDQTNLDFAMPILTPDTDF